MTPAEAAAMDPQQRCLLETSYRAFESGIGHEYFHESMSWWTDLIRIAGISLDQATGSSTSVHIGSLSHDWRYLLKCDGTRGVDYEGTGSEFSFLANRLSWFYDLKGPSLSLDTACSSSMMALHLACQGLKNGEAQMVRPSALHSRACAKLNNCSGPGWRRQHYHGPRSHDFDVKHGYAVTRGYLLQL